LSSVLRFEGAEKDGGWAKVCDCRVKNKDMTLGFYNNKPTSTTSRILEKWADPAPAAAFRFSIVIAVNMVVFLHNRWFPFLEPRKERRYSYQAHLFMQQPNNVTGCSVTSRINAVICFFQRKVGL